ncbi:AMIN domain-containing protein [Sulfuricurvum sp.]|uniref:AMIN domain-containing protein n=1 Tax=Sulfuricurvum sp. TaxID=2025608 RepID=UPI003BB1FBA8
MKFSLLVSLILLSPLVARENPFFTPADSKANKVTSNIPDTKPPLGTVNYTLPDQARILKEVTFTIQNLDGSIETRKMEIDHSIDWHRPISISQGSNASSAQPAAANSASSADFGFIRFNTKGKHLTIKTADPLVRHFVLSDPSRIVLDFKRNVTFKEEEKILNAAPYLKVTLGNHAKFIRATITLDGRYRYSLNKTGDLISITCK